MRRSGDFVRNASLVGQNIALPQIDPGESYDFTTIAAGITNQQTLVISSANSGWLISHASPAFPEGRIRQVDLTYEQPGPITSRITAIIPGDGGAIPAVTNHFLLLYLASDSGTVQWNSGGAMTSALGSFTQNRFLVGQDIAPTQLQPAESYYFRGVLAGITNISTLVVNSADSGVLIQSGEPTTSGLQSVDLHYQKLSPVCAILEAGVPADPANAIPGWTNQYILVFSVTNGGLFERSARFAMRRSGDFVRDTSLVGQNIALPQIDPGESYDFTTIAAGITNQQTLVISSAQSGWLITPVNPAFPGGAIRQVDLTYEHLGPISSRITAVLPSADGGATPAQTNQFLILFDYANEGRAELRNPAFPATSGVSSFVRNRSLVGQDVAPTQIDPGESYAFITVNGGMTNRSTLVVSTSDSGWLINENHYAPPKGAIRQVDLAFERLGPISSRITAVIPADGPSPAATNHFLLLYASASSGAVQRNGGGAMTSALGSFIQDRSLVGQDIAPVQLTASEHYSFPWNDGGATTREDTLVVNSATTGILIQSGEPTTSGLQSVDLHYQKLSPVCATLEVGTTDNPAAGQIGWTNRYILVFSETDTGLFERSDSISMRRSGHFVRDTSLVGRNITLPQIDPGESYAFVTVNGGMANRSTLVVSTSDSGWLINENQSASVEGSIRQVDLTYEHLGPNSSRITAILPGDGAIPAVTNQFLLLYNASGKGTVQWSDPGPMISSLGSFTQNRSLVGQNIAPDSLAPGETYSFTSITAGITNQFDLVVNTPQSGLWLPTDFSMPASRIQELTLPYQRVGPNSARLNSITLDESIPVSSRTNEFVLIYDLQNGGKHEQRNGPSISSGTFSRQPSGGQP